jgi:hypothetical protein
MIGATNPAFNRDHAAAVTSRHVCMAEARNDRCVSGLIETKDGSPRNRPLFVASISYSIRTDHKLD